MTQVRIMILNCTLFVVILGMGAFLLTQKSTFPGSPPINELVAFVERDLQENPIRPDEGRPEPKHLGTKNIFETIIAMPTPTPTPPPPPPAPPDIYEVTKEYRVAGVLSQIVVVEHEKTRDEHILRAGESFIVKYRNQDIPVYIEKMDRRTRTATFMIREMGVVQRRDVSMF